MNLNAATTLSGSMENWKTTVIREVNVNYLDTLEGKSGMVTGGGGSSGLFYFLSHELDADQKKMLMLGLM